MSAEAVSRGPVSRGRLSSAAALAGYALTSFLFVGIRPLVEGGHQFIGYGYDPQIFIWSFAWWPHAILSGHNPFLTHAVWAPYGVNLTWSTTVPGLALLFSPLTLTAGPIVAYDVAAVVLPALCAWTAFLLARYLTGAFWPSVVGGYLFGFSSWVFAENDYGGHINLGAVFLLPLIALVILRFLDGRMGGPGLVIRLGPTLALQALFSTEVAFSALLIIAGGLALGFAIVPERRRAIVSMVPSLLVSAGLAALLISPFLYFLLSGGVRGGFYASPDDFDLDFANLFVPTKLTLAGGTLLGGVSSRFIDNLPEQGAYLGLPTLLIGALYVRERSRSRTSWFLLAGFFLVILLALGPLGTFAGYQGLTLPWRLVQHLPVVDNVLTCRFMVYASLMAAVVVALWTAAQRPGWLRYLLPALAVASVAPNLWHSGLATSYSVPPFFTDSLYRACLDPGETVLPFPMRGTSTALLWQADDGFRFNLAGGDIGPDIPAQFFEPSSVAPVAGGLPLGVPDGGILRRFLAGKNVTSIVVDGNVANSYAGAVDQVASPQVVGGVYLYHLTKDAPSCPGS